VEHGITLSRGEKLIVWNALLWYISVATAAKKSELFGMMLIIV